MNITEKSALCDSYSPAHVQIENSELCYESPIFTIYNDEITFKSGERVKRQYMQHDDAVAIVALRQRISGASAEKINVDDIRNWEVLLIRQYRHAPRRIFWEIPAGLCDISGEAPLQAAQRELLEEAEVRAERWHKLVSFYASPGCSTERLDIFLALDIKVEKENSSFIKEAEEREITCAWYGLAEVEEQIQAGELASPTLVTGILAAINFISAGKLE